MEITLDDDVVVEIKIDEKNGEVQETVVKVKGEDKKWHECLLEETLFNPEWVRKKAIKYGDIAIKLTLDDMALNQITHEDVAKLTEMGLNATQLDKIMEKVAPTRHDYKIWKKNYTKLKKGADNLSTLMSYGPEIYSAITKLRDSDTENDVEATAEFLSNTFGAMGELVGRCKIPPAVLISEQLKLGSKLMMDSYNLVSYHVKQIQDVIDECEGITSVTGDQEALRLSPDVIKGIEELNRLAFITGADVPDLDKLNKLHDEYNNAVRAFEKKYPDVDINDNKEDNKDGNYIFFDPAYLEDSSAQDAEDQANRGANARVDPIVLDLKGDGFHPTTIKEGVNFDLDCNGMAERINWVQGDDAILAVDKNGDGVINDGSEVFGDNTLLASGKKALNGFQALAEYDTNKDGVITKEDADFSKLLVWKDSNRDGVSQKGELVSLSELHIKEIHVACKVLNTRTSSGAVLGNTSTFLFEDGHQANLAEYWVMSQKFNTVDKNPIDIPEEIAVLPDIKSMGNAYSLHKAMTLDTSGTLMNLVKEFTASQDLGQRKELVDQIIFRLTNSQDVEDGSRGPYMDAKKLAALECLLGQDFKGQFGENPHSAAAPTLNVAYDILANMYYCELSSATTLKDRLSYIRIMESTEKPTLDLSLFNSSIFHNIQTGDNGMIAFADAAKYVKYLDTYYYPGCFEQFESYFKDIPCNYQLMKTLYTASEIALVGSDANDYFYGSKEHPVLYGGNGQDMLSGSSGDDLLYGEDGDDKIYGNSGNDLLDGGHGNDTLDGGSGDDQLVDNYGDNTFVFGKGYGHDVVDTGVGTHTLRFTGLKPRDIRVNGVGEYDVMVTIHATGDTLLLKNFRKNPWNSTYNLEFDGKSMYITDAGSPFRCVYGGNGDDVLKAPLNEDTIISAMGGNDQIYAGNGNDAVYAGEGNDWVVANAGDDAVFGGSGDDSIDGGDGRDIIFGGNGNDVLKSGAGNDLLFGGQDQDTYVFGNGSGTDLLDDLTGETVIQLADGIHLDDVAAVHAGTALILQISGCSDRLVIQGYSGNENLFSIQSGNQVISLKEFSVNHTAEKSDLSWFATTNQNHYAEGGENGDWLMGGAYADRLSAGAGNDTLLGGAGNDQLLGGVGHDTLLGGDGHDYLQGGEGEDDFFGAEGNDFMYGGSGDDRYYFNWGDGQDTIQDTEGINTIVFGEGIVPEMVKAYRSEWDDLQLRFDNLTDTLTLRGYCADEKARNFRMVFADGTVIHATDSDSPLKTIYGTSSSENMPGIYDNGQTMIGMNGNDQLTGSHTDDFLAGEGGNDRLVGNEGNDILSGGAGKDIMKGGAGDDTYLYRRGDGADVILDAEGINSIDISDYSQYDLKAYRTGGNNMTISFGNSDSLTIQNYFVDPKFRNFYLSFNGGGKIHASSSYSPLRTIYGTDRNDRVESADGLPLIIKAGNGNDQVIGHNAGDILYGENGNDRLVGNDGNDILYGGKGKDQLEGGAGDDIYVFQKGDGADRITDAQGLNMIEFGSGLSAENMKVYRANWSDLKITFTDCSDQLTLRGYFDSADNRKFRTRFADGKVYESESLENPISHVCATAKNENLKAWSDAGVVMDGMAGDDTLNGGMGGDALFGGDGNDILLGNAGNDILNGGNGNDQLQGGAGDDMYIITTQKGEDILNDMEGLNQVVFDNIHIEDVVFAAEQLENSTQLTATIQNTESKLVIENYSSDRFTFEAADNVTGTVSADGVFTADLPDEQIASAASQLALLCDPVEAPAVSLDAAYDTENAGNVRENAAVMDQTGIQTLKLTEDMSAFGAEESVSQAMNLTQADYSVNSDLAIALPDMAE